MNTKKRRSEVRIVAIVNWNERSNNVIFLSLMVTRKERSRNIIIVVIVNRKNRYCNV